MTFILTEDYRMAPYSDLQPKQYGHPVVSQIDGTVKDLQIKEFTTFMASIYVGQRVRYSDQIIPIEHAEKLIHEKCNEIGLCVTITPTKFIYTSVDGRTGNPIDGEEPGFVVGFMQYPLYPKPVKEIKNTVEDMAVLLKELYQQDKVSVVYPDVTRTFI